MKSAHGKSRGFTVLEMLVAGAVLIVILVIILSIVEQISSATRKASDKISSFQNARAAFDTLTRTLSQSKLNSYWDYDDPNNPASYQRRSELSFTIGQAGVSPFPGTAGTGQAIFFQVALGINNDTSRFGNLQKLLNACGYYIQYTDEAVPAVFQGKVRPVYRYRLMQAIQPAEELAVYNATSSAWIGGLSSRAIPLANNIVYLLIWPRKSLAEDPVGNALSTNFNYDSRHNASASPQPETANQLPPLLQVTMVAIDDGAAARFCFSNQPPVELAGIADGLLETSTETAVQANLAEIGRRLSQAKINYQIYTTVVPLGESKME